MSLKARLRAGVAVLMTAMVVILAGLYVHGYLSATFRHTQETAQSVANQLQASLREDLQRATLSASPPPASAEEAVEFCRRHVAEDPAVAALLARSLGHWHMLSEIFITGPGSTILASSSPSRAGSNASSLPDLSEWTHRSLIANLRQVFGDLQDTEVQRPIAIAGGKTPVLDIHVVVSALFLSDEMKDGLSSLAGVAVVLLAAAIVLALLLPGLILKPLERLTRNLDRIASGELQAGSATRGEAREFAAVYSKLDTLGQQVRGARDDADQLRGNVEQLLDRLEAAVLLFDASGRITLAGRAVRGLLGVDPTELTGHTAGEAFGAAGAFAALVDHSLRPTSAWEPVTLYPRGRELRLLASAQPVLHAITGARIGTLVTLRDAESRGELAAQLDLANRLSALSRLTRGVAHEIKNPLNAITLHLEVLRSRLDHDAPELNVIARQIQRLDRVVKTFLDFNRPVQPQLRLLDLNEVTREIERLVRPDAEHRGIVIDTRLSELPAMLNGDRDLLQQAVLNVVVNAIEAMKDHGTLMLATRHNGSRVELMIADTGPGIPPEVQNRIFELYFSTKDGGSGIGLAMAFRFVQLLDGKIEFSSETGRGTTFRMSFPEAAYLSRSESELARIQA